MLGRLSLADLVCPQCQVGLVAAGAELECGGCGRHYPIVAGIPDLRLSEGPFISNADDRVKASRIAERARTASFAELVAHYYELTPEVPTSDRARFTSSMLGGVERSAHWLEVFSGLTPWNAAGRLVDVGCGTAPMLAAARPGGELVGVDIALRWLVIARKRLEESGIEATLICANAESLPLRAASASVVTMDSALEHVAGQEAAAREVFRVLAPGGVWLVATPNRWAWGPDPHIGVPFGGYLTSGMAARIARWRRALPPVRRLLGARSLRRLMRAAGFGSVRIVAPPIGAAQRARLNTVGRIVIDVMNRFVRHPIGDRALQAVGPLLAAAGRKA